MARNIHRLNAKQITACKDPGRYGDGGNLYLSVQSSGAQRWVFMYRLNGRQREMMLGSAEPAYGISLSRARQLAADARAQLADGHDPIDARRKARQATRKLPTFAEYVDVFLKHKQGSWRAGKSEGQWRMTLGVYCKPIAATPVDGVDVAAVLKCLQPIWTTKCETARRLRGRIEKVLDSAKAEGLRSGENPAAWRGNLEAILSRHDPLRRKHHAALDYEALPGFLEELRSRSSTAALALEFAILTATRTGEVLGATWTEIDTENRIWTIPKTRTKTGREYRIPLSEPALRILGKMHEVRCGEFVFQGQAWGKPLSNMSMLQLLKRMGRGYITTHGFRSTFRDWGAEKTNFSNEVMEMALGHRIRDKAEEAYRRRDLFEKRRTLMEHWAAYCERKPTDNVVKFQHG